MKKTILALSLFAFLACKNEPKIEKPTNTPTKEEVEINKAQDLNREIQKNLKILYIYKVNNMQDSVQSVEARLQKLEEELNNI